MAKTLTIFKTHFIDESVISELDKLVRTADDSHDVILFLDNSKRIVDNAEEDVVIDLCVQDKQYKCFLYDENVHRKSGLPLFSDNLNNDDIGKILWYNSDYPFYLVYKYLPEYEYYWTIEYDVFCNDKDYKKFYAQYDSIQDDLIVTDYRVIGSENWHWKYYSEWLYENTKMYASLFPVVRLSNKAIDFLYKRRIEIGKLYEDLDKRGNRWIFCELFVPTELTNNGFKCSNLDEPNVRFLPVWNLNKQRVFENPDGKLYHPVK